MDRFHKRDLEQACELFRSIVAEFPEESELLERVHTWLRICEKAVVPKPSRPQTAEDHYKLGIVRYNEGQLGQALEHFDRALVLEPRSDKIHYVMAAAYALRSEGDRSLEHLKKAIDLNEDNRVFAANDTDFDLLKEHAEFRALVSSSDASSAGNKAL
jgi:tetratricopeptide (TPR) repeat protein